MRPAVRLPVPHVMTSVAPRPIDHAPLAASPAFDGTAVILWMTDANGQCTFVDGHWTSFTGQPVSEALGEGWLRMLHDADRTHVAREYLGATAEARSYRGEFRVRRADGAWRWCLSAAAPWLGADGAFAGHVGTIIDVDDQRGAAMRLRETVAALEVARAEAERQRAAAAAASAAKSRFVATLSHELRTPLNAIQGHVHLLLLGIHGALADAQRDGLARVQRAERHLARLIDDVLDLARLESGRVTFTLADVPVADLVRDILPLVEGQADEAGLVLDVAPALASPLVVHADRERAGQVLLNLVGNAIKFTPGSGAEGAVGHVTLAAAADGAGRVTLTVRDTGPGIADTEQAVIFEPFVQVSTGSEATRRSTGLGLAISRELARGMGGDLQGASTPGQGSTFTFTLAGVNDGR